MPKTVAAPNAVNLEWNRPTGPITSPEVLFIGDSITTAWLTPAVLAAHPYYHLAPPPTDAQSKADAPNYTTADLLKGLPGALKSCPQCVVTEIMAGTWDYLSGNNEFVESGCPNPPFLQFPPDTQNTCQNIEAMVTKAQSHGMAIVVGTLPPLGPSAEVTKLLGYSDAEYVYGDIQELNYTILSTYGDAGKQGVLPGGGPVVAAVDYHAALVDPNDPDEALYLPADTSDGINPSAAGAQVMVEQLEAVLKAMGEDMPR
jgi:hypothetical protein